MKRNVEYTVEVQYQPHRSGLERMRQAYLKLVSEPEEKNIEPLAEKEDSHLCTNEPQYMVEYLQCNKKKMQP